MKEKWTAASPKLEAVLVHNGGEYFVGKAITYPDILVSHLLTWFVEEVSVCKLAWIVLLLLLLLLPTVDDMLIVYKRSTSEGSVSLINNISSLFVYSVGRTLSHLLRF